MDGYARKSICIYQRTPYAAGARSCGSRRLRRGRLGLPLILLLEWQKICPIDIAVVHVNHGIRAEAGEDARYVEKLCGERKIPYFLTRADVRDRAGREKISEEEAGRRTRYEAFEQVAKEWGATKIAVAHNSNDRSETQLFHLFGAVESGDWRAYCRCGITSYDRSCVSRDGRLKTF